MAYFRSLSRSSAAANRFTPHLPFSSTAVAAPHLTQSFAGLVPTDPRKDQPRATGSAGFRLMKGVDTRVFDVDSISPGSRTSFSPFESRIHPAVSRATGSHLFMGADPDSRTVHCETITDGADGNTLEPRKFKVSYDKLANESEAKASTLGIHGVTDHAPFLRERIQPRIQERAEKEKRDEQMLSQHFSQRMPQEKTESGTDRLGFSGAGNFKPMNFVQSILEEDEQGLRKKIVDVVHVLLTRKKTFVTVTDARGNKKTGASAGCLEDRKGRSRLSRYAAEATAEHIGRSARKMGLKSVVVKVKGSIFFRKKKKVILSWREGFRGEGVGDQSPIVSIHDMTQLPHNGCRLPKKRRV